MPVGLSREIQQQVERGVAILKEGGVIAFPTDTVYGLGASACIDNAVERVFQTKRRPPSKALLLLLADVSQINDIARDVSQTAWSLAKAFSPGALTLVLRRSGAVSDVITAGGDTVAVRVPCHPVPIALIEGIGAPLVGTSANRSGMPSALNADEVRTQFGDEIDMVVDSDTLPGGTESTIVDMTGETPALLRQGAISIGELRRVCADIVVKGG